MREERRERGKEERGKREEGKEEESERERRQEREERGDEESGERREGGRRERDRKWCVSWCAARRLRANSREGPPRSSPHHTPGQNQSFVGHERHHRTAHPFPDRAAADPKCVIHTSSLPYLPPRLSSRPCPPRPNIPEDFPTTQAQPYALAHSQPVSTHTAKTQPRNASQLLILLEQHTGTASVTNKPCVACHPRSPSPRPSRRGSCLSAPPTVVSTCCS